MKRIHIQTIPILLMLFITACQPEAGNALPGSIIEVVPAAAQEQEIQAPAFISRPMYEPGELVDYVAQPGDTLSSLSRHFNTTVEEIKKANAFIPEQVTTMPPGMPMKIPIYYAPFWGSPYQILPDSQYVYGSALIGFQLEAFIQSYPGWLNGYREFASGETRSASEIIEMVSRNFSVSPKLLLALLEYQAGGLTQPEMDVSFAGYPLGNRNYRYRGLYLQLTWAANFLNNAYYGWRIGSLESFEHLDGKIERPDPWQNAATVALHVYFSQKQAGDAYLNHIAEDGFARIYRDLYGDPWIHDVPHLSGSLEQPQFALPYKPGNTWAYTGGPHTAWGDGLPLAALDFAPGLLTGGCTPTDEWALAVADGVVARSEPGTVLLDLDGDGDERTGWVVFYFHLGAEGRVPAGTVLKKGDPVGHPSCEGGRATGTHIHIARKYNGEWIPAGGELAFNLEGWVASYGAAPYFGTLRRYSLTKTACTCSDAFSQITAGQE
jgi:LasA protease